MGFFQNLLQDAAGTAFGSDYLRDYAHASKTFRTNLYEKAPKFKFLFHTEFAINPALGIANPNFGVLVRDIKLPSFKIDTKEFNQYNRKRIIQSKIKYDPISITFHDDNSNLINKLWVAYYTYYYKDGANPSVVFSGARGKQKEEVQFTGNFAGNNSNSGLIDTNNNLTSYNDRTQYATPDDFRQSSNWGYYGEASVTSQNPSIKVPFFKNITVFGFFQHNFTAYTLINPMITSFSHDTYSYDEGNGTMKNTMTIDYETVVYNQGAIDGRDPSNIIATFGNQTDYDRTLSPIAKPGSNGTILGKGGLIDSVGGAIELLGSGNPIGAIITAGTAYQTAKRIDLKETAKIELETMLRNAALNTPNTRNVQFDFPGAFTSPGPAGLAGSPPIYAQQGPANVNREGTAGTQVSG
jgi:hypothetical protein